ncbi:MAG: T9SS type A sorting domain-containing protein, partial [candidate division WOR-3 bacterium]
GINYSRIAHGISGNDTSYLWTVPNVNSDSCKIKIIAYGPGWQYDESDGVFSITSTGINEIASPLLAMTLGVKVYPNPAKSLSVIRYSLPVEGKVTIQLYNISGRLIKTLVDEYKQPGNYSLTLNSKILSNGVYFLSLQTNAIRIIKRLVVVK